MIEFIIGVGIGVFIGGLIFAALVNNNGKEYYNKGEKDE